MRAASKLSRSNTEVSTKSAQLQLQDQGGPLMSRGSHTAGVVLPHQRKHQLDGAGPRRV